MIKLNDNYYLTKVETTAMTAYGLTYKLVHSCENGINGICAFYPEFERNIGYDYFCGSCGSKPSKLILNKCKFIIQRLK